SERKDGGHVRYRYGKRCLIMTAPGALDAAFGLARMPNLAGALREQPLPEDVLVLIRIAAGSEQDLERERERYRCTDSALKSVSELYLQQVILHPKADSYRLLAAGPDASKDTISEHRKWLMK